MERTKAQNLARLRVCWAGVLAPLPDEALPSKWREHVDAVLARDVVSGAELARVFTDGVLRELELRGVGPLEAVRRLGCAAAP